MKHVNRLFILFLLCLNVAGAVAQGKADIFNGSSEITWLGIDFSQAKFIGKAAQFKDAGEITNSEFRDKYVPGWNQLFIDEKKKYDVAGAVKRSEVKYAVEVTEKANSSFKGNFFSEDPNDYTKLNEQKVADLVKSYDFQGNTGIGFMFFIDGMSKSKDEASGWVTFVDMKSKKVLLTEYKTGKGGGIGFRNYWAKSFYNMLKAAEKMKG
jgi:hypothetical protein